MRLLAARVNLHLRHRYKLPRDHRAVQLCLFLLFLTHARPIVSAPTAALHFGALLCHQNLVSGSSPFLFVPIRPVSETKKAGGLCSFLCPGDSAYRRLIFRNAWPQPYLPN